MNYPSLVLAGYRPLKCLPSVVWKTLDMWSNMWQSVLRRRHEEWAVLPLVKLCSYFILKGTFTFPDAATVARLSPMCRQQIQCDIPGFEQWTNIQHSARACDWVLLFVFSIYIGLCNQYICSTTEHLIKVGLVQWNCILYGQSMIFSVTVFVVLAKANLLIKYESFSADGN